MRRVSALLGLLLPASSWACSCISGLVCEMVSGAAVVFLGTALEKIPKRTGVAPELELYRFRVTESYKGGLPNETELLIDPDNFSSCRASFDAGQSYVILARPHPGKIETARIRSGQTRRLFFTSQCSNFLAEGRVDDIAWLRAYAKGETQTRIYGLVAQVCCGRERTQQYGSSEPPLADARISITGTGQTFTTRAGSDGSYSFDGIPAGSYELKAEKPPLSPAPPLPVEVSAGRCAFRMLELQPHGLVRGVVLDHEQTPKAGIDVQLMRVHPNGVLARCAAASVTTDAQGRFAIPSAPEGRFVLGVNLRRTPDRRAPFPPVYLPASRNLEQAQILELRPDGVVEDLRLQLPPPLLPRTVRVEVYWSDGTPVNHGAYASYTFQGRKSLDQHWKAGNFVELEVLEGLDYQIDVKWKMPYAKPPQLSAPPVNLPSGRGAATLKVTLPYTKPPA